MGIAQVPLPSGEKVPALGQGTFRMAEDIAKRQAEIRALELGIDLGMSLIDTAEAYADGGAEELTGEAISGRRDEVFLVTKVLPTRASQAGVIIACEKSLTRLKTDRIDLYLVHWRGERPLEGTLAGFDALKAAGKIRYWGVSNFEPSDLDDLVAAGGADVASNQVPFNLGRRGIELGTTAWMAARNIPVMAYSPIARGALAGNKTVRRIAAARGATPTQVALAFVLSRPEMIAIPKSGDEAHLRENRGASDIALTVDELALLDGAFPLPAAPTRFHRSAAPK